MSDAVVMPVYNEEGTLGEVLDAVRHHFAGVVIVVDDGSADATPEVLRSRRDVVTVTHPENLGYGKSLRDGWEVASALSASRVVTMDCDGQHEPAHIPRFLSELGSGDDIVSGSRYLPDSRPVGATPASRFVINARMTAEVNRATGWAITDAFCGFKAYRLDALVGLGLREPGYALPMELWAKAFLHGLTVRELPVERIYFDHDRSFGADLDDPERRLAYYLRVWRGALGEADTEPTPKGPAGAGIPPKSSSSFGRESA